MRLLMLHQGYELYGSDRMFLLSIVAAKEAYPETDITVWLPRQGVLYDKILGLGVNIEIRKMGVLRKKDFKKVGFAILKNSINILLVSPFKLVSIFNSFDIIYINSIANIDAVIASRYSKTKVFIHVHEIPLGVVSRIFSFLLKFSKAHLILISEAVDKHFSLLNNKKDIVVNGVCAIREIDNKTVLDDKLKLLLIGRLNSWKGQELLVKAINKKKKIFNNKISVRIVGDVFEDQIHYKENLLFLIKKLKIEHLIEICPFANDPSLHYNWSDVVIVPSTKPEPFGLVSVEAMSLGKPIIGADHGGLSDIIINEHSGLLFKPKDAEDLSSKIEFYFNNRELIKSHGLFGKRLFNEKYSESTYKENIVKAIFS